MASTLKQTTEDSKSRRSRLCINGVAVNMPEFRQAFIYNADAALVKPEQEICRIW